MRIPVAHRASACIALLGLLQPICFIFAQAQSSASSSGPLFVAADVHANTHRGYHYVHGGEIIGSRYSLSDATMVNLIAKAYGVKAGSVFGGPNWLELNRYDVVAVVRPGTTPENLKRMLQALLSDRFHLVVHAGTKPMAAYVLSLGKSKPNLKESTGGSGKCDYHFDITQHPPTRSSCRNVTIEDFAANLEGSARDYLKEPVVDSTGLQGTWDFDLQWSPIYNPENSSDRVSVFDAVDKQLDLKLELKVAPLPVMIVDHVDEKPTSNPPGTEESLPLPPKEFEVAVIRPSGASLFPTREWRADGVNLQHVSMALLILQAWGINQFLLADHPKWIDNTYFDIRAKVAMQPGDRNVQALDYENAQPLMRSLLADRFKLKAHMEDRLTDAYVLTAVSPKLKKADPANRSKCWPGPASDIKQPPPEISFLSCQNITLDQFAEQLTNFGQMQFAIPVLDATHIEGSYDFSLSYGFPNSSVPIQPPPGVTSEAPEPSGARTLVEAVRQQLGLKLEKQKRPIPMLVIDHIEDKPTDN
jgi:uncharacterized protein (TIGR03435 family)